LNPSINFGFWIDVSEAYAAQRVFWIILSFKEDLYTDREGLEGETHLYFSPSMERLETLFLDFRL
jgi:hypothetical protein